MYIHIYYILRASRDLSEFLLNNTEENPRKTQNKKKYIYISLLGQPKHVLKFKSA